MKAHSPNAFSPMNMITGIAGILFGIIVGYIIGSNQVQPVQQVVAASQAAAPQVAVHANAATTVLSEADLQPFKEVLAKDPANATAAAQLANKLYDAGRYTEAITYYQQAFKNDPKNVNVSTDLGTAMFYSGRTDEALTQLQKSLAIDPNHGQTLFNIGIVKRDGKKDPKGAVEAWQKLLASNPGYPEAERVRALIAETR
jgi:cytochrome c-type biogenesis protein CcmH/NrfG